jgi:hypothetical protein
MRMRYVSHQTIGEGLPIVMNARLDVAFDNVDDMLLTNRTLDG